MDKLEVGLEVVRGIEKIGAKTSGFDALTSEKNWDAAVKEKGKIVAPLSVGAMAVVQALMPATYHHCFADTGIYNNPDLVGVSEQERTKTIIIAGLLDVGSFALRALGGDLGALAVSQLAYNAIVNTAVETPWIARNVLAKLRP